MEDWFNMADKGSVALTIINCLPMNEIQNISVRSAQIQNTCKTVGLFSCDGCCTHC